jgi:hypothetical protein
MHDVAVAKVKAQEVGIAVVQLVESVGWVAATPTAVRIELGSEALRLMSPTLRPPPVTNGGARDASEPGDGAVVDSQVN